MSQSIKTNLPLTSQSCSSFTATFSPRLKTPLELLLLLVGGAARGLEDVLEVLDSVCSEKHQEDEGPQSQDEAVRGVPVLLLRFLVDDL